MAFCNNCGKELTQSDRFCPECGAPQLGETQAAYTTPGGGSPPMGYPPPAPGVGAPPPGYPPFSPPPKKNKVLLWVLIPLAVLLLGGLTVAAVFLLDPSKQVAAVSSSPSGSGKSSSSNSGSSSSSKSSAPSATQTIADSRWDGAAPSEDEEGYSIVFQKGKAYLGTTYDTTSDIVSYGLTVTYKVNVGTIVFTNTNTKETATCKYTGSTIVDTNGVMTAIDSYTFYRK